MTVLSAGLYRQEDAQRIAASSSVSWPLELTTWTLEMLPSLLTINLMVVVPCWLRRTAKGGYSCSQLWDPPIETGAVMPCGFGGAGGGGAGVAAVCTGGGMTGCGGILATVICGGGCGV